MNEPGYDVIGDVHGEGKKLVELLTNMGYTDDRGYFEHPTRKAVFVGDLIDRGPEQLLAVRTAKAMTDAGTAHVVMGNHEFNAIGFHTKTEAWATHVRERNSKNIHQHKAFLDAVTPDSQLHGEIIDWFWKMPMWFEQDGLRVVHACWEHVSIEKLNNDPVLTEEVLVAANTKGTPEYEAVEILLKGPEIDINPPYHDVGGHHRDKARHAWWRGDSKTMADAIEVPANVTQHLDETCPGKTGQPWTLTDPTAPVSQRPVEVYGKDAPPVIFGHYWRTGTPELEGPNTACVDYSACKGGPLVAYRWSGGAVLDSDGFVWSP